MGRSVMTVHDATVTAYSTFEPDEEYYRQVFDDDVADGIVDEDDDFETFMYRRFELDSEYEWGSYVEWIIDSAQHAWPSLHEPERTSLGNDRETVVLLENAHSQVTVAEYCGAVAISLIPKYDRHTFWADPEYGGAKLGEHWRKQIAERFEKTFGTMTPLVRFSNGEVGYTTKKEG